MDASIIRINVQRMQKLASRLQQAVERIDNVMPLNPLNFEPDQFDADAMMFLDAFRTRFSDLQDIIGKTMFHVVAVYDQEESPAHRLSMRERINLMEQKGLVGTSEWNELREIRNSFAHEYPDEAEEKAEALNAAWRLSSKLADLTKKIESYLCA